MNRIVAFVVFASLLCDCSMTGHGSFALPARAPATHRIASAHSVYLYVGGYAHGPNHNFVNLYPLGSTVAVRSLRISGAVALLRMAVDNAGDLYQYLQRGARASGIYVTPPGKNRGYSLRSGASTATAMLPDPTSNDMFVALQPPLNQGRQSIGVYSPGDRRPARTIDVAPRHMAFDATGNLYVEINAKGGSSIAVYPPGASQPLRTIRQGLTNASAMTVDSAGTVYVVDTSSARHAKRASIVVYPPGASLPRYTIASGVATASALAAAPDGDLYVTTCKAGYCGHLTEIAVYAPAATRPSRTIDVANEVPQRMLFDSRGNLYVMYHSPKGTTVTAFRSGTSLWYTVSPPRGSSLMTIGPGPPNLAGTLVAAGIAGIGPKRRL